MGGRDFRRDGSLNNSKRPGDSGGVDLRQQALTRRAIQRKASRPKAAAGRPRIPEGGGQSLAQNVREQMEPELGAELGDVRVHTESKSATAAQQLGARAFTVGSDVHFNAGEFAPGTREGDRLLAHELTHVVQGRHGGVQRKAAPGREDDVEVSSPHEPAEQEADAVADRAVGGIHDGHKGARGPVQHAIGGVGRKVHLSPNGTSTTQKPAATTQKSAGPQAPAGATPAGQVPVAAGGPEGGVDPNFEHLDPAKVKSLGGGNLDGTSDKEVVEYDGKTYLFKPCKGDAPVMRAQDAGIQQGQYARRAAAGAGVAAAVGLDTPGARLVEIGGHRGSLQDWTQGKTLKEIHLDEPAVYAQIVKSPEFQTLRSDIMALDYLINNLDRNEGNFFVDLAPSTAEPVKLRPIDHDLCFTKDPDRPPVQPGWIDGFPEKYTRQMWDNLKKLKANAGQFGKVLEKFLMQQEIAGVFKRLDDLLADIEHKIKTKGDKGTFHS